MRLFQTVTHVSILVCAFGNVVRAQTIRVDATPSHVVNKFSPPYALGTTVDRVPSNATDTFFAPDQLKQTLEAGWGVVSFAKTLNCLSKHGTGILQAHRAILSRSSSRGKMNTPIPFTADRTSYFGCVTLPKSVGFGSPFRLSPAVQCYLYVLFRKVVFSRERRQRPSEFQGLAGHLSPLLVGAERHQWRPLPHRKNGLATAKRIAVCRHTA